jgi:hypothetical protein
MAVLCHSTIKGDEFCYVLENEYLWNGICEFLLMCLDSSDRYQDY